MRSPCGPYSQCRAVNDHAICSCLSGYFGRPPNCHPECISNSDCPADKSCMNQMCSDPCPGICGYNARCHVVNHNPICSCNAGYTGDPFVRCVEEISKNCPSGQVDMFLLPSFGCQLDRRCRKFRTFKVIWRYRLILLIKLRLLASGWRC